MKRVTVAFGQSIYDMAIQETGSVEGVFDLMADNPAVIIDLNTELVPGVRLFIKTAPADKRVLKFFTDNKLQPATWMPPSSTPNPGLLNVDDVQLENTDEQDLYNVN